MNASIAQYFRTSTKPRPIYVAMRAEGGDVLTWSVSRAEIKRQVGRQWEPQAWRIIRLQEVPNV